MGTTLSNGVYLPDEGERNCYAGLKVNWEILNQKVADISALQLAIAGALHRQIVASLPTEDIDPNTIYMILSGTSATENVYNEFMYVNNAWELIGTSATDLTNYYTKAEVDGKLLLKANASDLTSHTGDTTIHVTANDKTKWTNSANTHVLRLAKSALTPSSSTNAFSNLDDSTALKVGDKVMDTAGVLFEVTAIDTQNSTFTIGTALIDLAQDSDVVHKSGNETVGGKKTFSDDLTIYNSDSSQSTKNLNISSSKIQVGDTSNSDAFGIRFNAGASYVAQILAVNDTAGTQNLQLSIRTKDSSDNFITSMVRSRLSANGNSSFEPGANDSISLGSSSFKWKSVYATNYYYGSNNVEFSTKFVTTDTAQTISGNKTFASNVNVYNSDNTATTPNFTLRSSKSAIGTSDTDVQTIFFSDKNGTSLASVKAQNFTSNGATYLLNSVNTKDTNDQIIEASTSLYILNNGRKVFRPNTDNEIFLGYSLQKWKDFLSLPSGNVNDVIDISSYITALDGTSNSYTAPANGWISIAVVGTAIAIVSSSWSDSRYRTGSGNVRMLYPVLKNETLGILVTGTTLAYARFIPCQGNV